MKDSKQSGSEKGVIHNQNAPNECDIVGTPTGINPRENEACICVFVLCDDKTCFAELFELNVTSRQCPCFGTNFHPLSARLT